MKYLATLLVLALGASIVSPSRACDCVAHPKLPKRPLVFEGTVLRQDFVDMPSKDGHLERYIRYSFKISKQILGKVNSEAYVYSTSSDCQKTFEVGKLYHVTAGRYDDFGDNWFTTSCFENKLIRDVRATIGAAKTSPKNR